jgi:hypothetical protein
VEFRCQLSVDLYHTLPPFTLFKQDNDELKFSERDVYDNASVIDTLIRMNG